MYAMSSSQRINSKYYYLPLYTLIMLGLMLLFFPKLDIGVSSLFFRKESMDFIGNASMFQQIYLILIPCSYVSCFAIVMSRNEYMSRKCVYTFLCAFCIIILCSTISKNFFHRPRPYSITEFGGRYDFSLPLHIGDCKKNCSFVSGHATISFALCSFCILLKKKDVLGRGAISAIACTLGAICGATRVIRGMHFMSDIVFAGLLSYSVLFIFLININEQNERCVTSRSHTSII